MSESTYDAIPYTSYPYERTHPDRLATVARLFGLDPVAPSRARVLELGCASGGNLLPMAAQLPDAELVGIDLSARQLEVARQAADAAGLSNVTLHCGDLAEIDDSWGEFDYIVCHGVMSWVARPVQDRILEIFARRLRPHGIAHVSYNTYPGWHLREATRRMMQYHVAQFDDPVRRTEQAAALLRFVVDHGPSATRDNDRAWSSMMQREAELLAALPVDYLFHEHLEEHNTPMYFYEFHARVVEHGLAYLGDSDVSTMVPDPLPTEAARQLQAISPDLTRLEQYLDFVRGRQFRNSLLCPGACRISRDLAAPRVHPFFVGLGTSDSPSPVEVDLTPGVAQRFVAARGVSLTSDIPITKAALALLAERWPQVLRFDALVEAARARLEAHGVTPVDADADTLAADVLRCYIAGGVELRTEAPSFTTTPGETPQADAYARWQAERYDFVTNRRHHRVHLDAAARQVLLRLDGQHTRAHLTDALAQRVRDGMLTLSKDDRPLTDPSEWTQPLRAVVDHTLARLAEGAVLIA